MLTVFALCLVTAIGSREGGADETEAKFLVESDGAQIQVPVPGSQVQKTYQLRDKVRTGGHIGADGLFADKIDRDPEDPTNTSGDAKEGDVQEEEEAAETVTKLLVQNCPHGRKDIDGDCLKGCPENSIAQGPDSEGNCECKTGYRCNGSPVLSMAHVLAKELAKHENAEKVIKLAQEDTADDDAGGSLCPIAVGETHADQKDAQLASSQVKFGHGCKDCWCKSVSDGAAIPQSIPLATFGFVLAIFVIV